MDWDKVWSSFISNLNSVAGNKGVCAERSSLDSVTGDPDGIYQFSCSKSPELCDCARSVGTGTTNAGTQYFVNKDMKVYLGVYRDSDSGATAYEICEIDGECHAYGALNEEDVEGALGSMRRRRLLQANSHGNC